MRCEVSQVSDVVPVGGATLVEVDWRVQARRLRVILRGPRWQLYDWGGGIMPGIGDGVRPGVRDYTRGFGV